MDTLGQQVDNLPDVQRVGTPWVGVVLADNPRVVLVDNPRVELVGSLLVVQVDTRVAVAQEGNPLVVVVLAGSPLGLGDSQGHHRVEGTLLVLVGNPLVLAGNPLVLVGSHLRVLVDNSLFCLKV